MVCNRRWLTSASNQNMLLCWRLVGHFVCRLDETHSRTWHNMFHWYVYLMMVWNQVLWFRMWWRTFHLYRMETLYPITPHSWFDAFHFIPFHSVCIWYGIKIYHKSELFHFQAIRNGIGIGIVIFDAVAGWRNGFHIKLCICSCLLHTTDINFKSFGYYNKTENKTKPCVDSHLVCNAKA